jgi:RecA-family ATPase
MNENDNGEPTVFVGMLEALAQETGAAVLVSHHTRKADKNSKSYKTALEAEAMRGASAFIGAARWQMNLTTLTSEESKKIIGDRHPEPGQYLAGRTCKKNYGKPESEFFLERGVGGVLRPVAPAKTITTPDPAGQIRGKIIETIQELADQEKKTTAKQLRDLHRKKWITDGAPSATREMTQAVIDQMVMDGDLVEVRETSPNGRTPATYLTLPAAQV